MIAFTLIEAFLSYMPLVYLSISSSLLFRTDSLAGIFVLIWKFLLPLLPKIYNNLKVSIICSVLCLLSLTLLWKEQYVICILISGGIGVPWICSNVSKNRYKFQSRNLIVILGILFAGILLEDIKIYAIIYFILLFVISLKVHSLKSLNELEYKNIKKNTWEQINYLLILNSFFHNLSYYLFIISLPQYIFSLYENYTICGVLSTFSWLLFFPRKYIFEKFEKKIGSRASIILGYFISFITISLLGSIKDLILLGSLILCQSAAGGIAESFFYRDDFIKYKKEYLVVWKIGGAAGCVLNSCLSCFVAYRDIFIISAFLYLFMSVVNYKNLFDKS